MSLEFKKEGLLDLSDLDPFEIRRKSCQCQQCGAQNAKQIKLPFNGSVQQHYLNSKYRKRVNQRISKIRFSIKQDKRVTDSNLNLFYSKKYKKLQHDKKNNYLKSIVEQTEQEQQKRVFRKSYTQAYLGADGNRFSFRNSKQINGVNFCLVDQKQSLNIGQGNKLQNGTDYCMLPIKTAHSNDNHDVLKNVVRMNFLRTKKTQPVQDMFKKNYQNIMIKNLVGQSSKFKKSVNVGTLNKPSKQTIFDLVMNQFNQSKYSLRTSQLCKKVVAQKNKKIELNEMQDRNRQNEYLNTVQSESVQKHSCSQKELKEYFKGVKLILQDHEVYKARLQKLMQSFGDGRLSQIGQNKTNCKSMKSSLSESSLRGLAKDNKRIKTVIDMRVKTYHYSKNSEKNCQKAYKTYINQVQSSNKVDQSRLTK